MCYNYRHRVCVAFKDRKEVIDMEKAFKFRIYPNKTKEIVGSIKLLKYFKELVSKEKIQSSLLLKSC